MVKCVESALPELAVIVLAVRAQPELKSAVASLLRQSVPLEIVVVNSGGGNPANVLPSGAENVRIISVRRLLSAGGARNRGIRATRAPWVAFLAADCIAEENWAAARLARHRQGQMAVASAVLNSHPRNAFAWASHLAVYPRRLPGVPTGLAITYGASYSRKLFKAYGLFREDLKVGEDTDFKERLPRRHRPVWAPEVCTTHANPTTLPAMMRDAFRRGYRSRRNWRQPWFGRFWTTVQISRRAVPGKDRVYVAACWPFLALYIAVYNLGVLRQKQLMRAKDPSLGS